MTPISTNPRNIQDRAKPSVDDPVIVHAPTTLAPAAPRMASSAAHPPARRPLREGLDRLYTAVVADALDAIGLRSQCPRVPLPARTGVSTLFGRCRTTSWEDLSGDDPRPYELELKAVDGCEPGDIIIAAANGSCRSGIWGELLSTAARNAGCSGVIVDGAVRDIAKMTDMGFPCFARLTSPYDSQHRQRVTAVGQPVQIDGVTFRDGDLVFVDADGVVVVPAEVEDEVLDRAISKIDAENVTRDAISKGMRATDAYARYGVL